MGLQKKIKGRHRRRSLIVLGALLLLFIAYVSVSYRLDLAAAKYRIASGSRVADSACGSIEYAISGTGPALLLLHGGGGGFDQSLEIGRPLVDAGFQVIAVSRFGYLRTPLPEDASPSAQADVYACLLDRLHLPRVAVIGGSAGAPSAMQFCLRHARRCAAMILLVPAVYLPPPQDASPIKPPSALTRFAIKTLSKSDFLLWATIKFAGDALAGRVFVTSTADFNAADADERQRLIQLLHHLLPISARADGLWNDATIIATLPRYALEDIAVPTLVVSVEDDLFDGYRRSRYTAEHIPGARLVRYKSGGHLWVGHDRELWSEVIGFLRPRLNQR